MKRKWGTAIRLLAALCSWVNGFDNNAPAQATFFGPSSYLSFTDSPFSSNTFSYFHLEDFESGSLSTPGVTASPGWVVNPPGIYTDSVDADDGVIDGAGTNAHSFYSNLTETNLTITFDAAALGGSFPSHAGIVWTDVGKTFTGLSGYGDVTFTAYDEEGLPLGTLLATNLGNGSALGSGPGATAEDRFFGVIYSAGISSIRISMDKSADWEVDHLQYGLGSTTALQPALQIQRVAPDTAIITWPVSATGFELQQNQDLSPTNWLTVTNLPEQQGGTFQVLVSPVPSPAFYRLHLP